MFFNKMDSVRIGKVVSRLGYRRFGFGEIRFCWKRAYFSDFRIGRGGLNPHIVVVGESGVGKSNAVKIIIERLCSDGANVVILDPHNEYLGTADAISAAIYDAARNGVNIFDLDGMGERERAGEITGMLKRSFRLGEVQTYMLYKCIMSMYSYSADSGRMPSMQGLERTIMVFKNNSGAKPGERSVLESLERRLSVVDMGSSSKGTDMARVIKSNSLFLLSGLHTPEAQALYLEGFLRKIYAKMLTLDKVGRPFLYVVIDEAEKLGDNPILGKIAAEGRKYGIGIIAAGQRAKSIDRDLRNNSSIFVSFYQREPEELNYISNFIAGGNELSRFTEVKKGIRSLRRGHAVVVDSEKKEPFVVKFDMYRRENKSIEFSVVQLCRNGIPKAELEEALGISFGAEEIGTAVSRLLSNNTIAGYEVGCDEYSGTWYISSPRNSPEHDICVGVIARSLSACGVRNRIYNSSYGPDVIAYSTARRIAIEYETGLKSIDGTKEMLYKRQKYYSRVLVVVNDRFYDSYCTALEGFEVLRFSDMGRLATIINLSAAS